MELLCDEVQHNVNNGDLDTGDGKENGDLQFMPIELLIGKWRQGRFQCGLIEIRDERGDQQNLEHRAVSNDVTGLPR